VFFIKKTALVAVWFIFKIVFYAQLSTPPEAVK